LSSLRNLENRLEIKRLFVLLANSDTFQRKKKFGPTPDGGEILVKVQISDAIIRKRSPSSEFDQ
jgi:hypothetical protein